MNPAARRTRNVFSVKAFGIAITFLSSRTAPVGAVEDPYR
jgi:hypothetical protein